VDTAVVETMGSGAGSDAAVSPVDSMGPLNSATNVMAADTGMVATLTCLCIDLVKHRC
jgi:hypothetical protein